MFGEAFDKWQTKLEEVEAECEDRQVAHVKKEGATSSVAQLQRHFLQEHSLDGHLTARTFLALHMNAAVALYANA